MSITVLPADQPKELRLGWKIYERKSSGCYMTPYAFGMNPTQENRDWCERHNRDLAVLDKLKCLAGRGDYKRLRRLMRKWATTEEQRLKILMEVLDYRCQFRHEEDRDQTKMIAFYKKLDQCSRLLLKKCDWRKLPDGEWHNRFDLLRELAVSDIQPEIKSDILMELMLNT